MSLQKLLFITFLILFLVIEKVNAQTISDTLREVKISAKQKPSAELKLNEFSPGQKITSLDSQILQQYRFQNMGNLLSQQTSAFVKSYGFNNLSTLNFRGSSAAQNTVLWNGIPIQNAALGIADISTLPVLFMNKVNIVYGGSAALWGSGNVGGALLLESDAPVFDSGKKSLSLAGGTGSFGQYMYGAKAAIIRKRWYFSANAYAQTALNNFKYSSLSGVPERITNSTLKSNAVMLQAAYKINTGNIVNLLAWYQEYDREIPPALFETYSDKKQIDKTIRLLADWKRQAHNNTWYAKTSFIRDEIDYNDAGILLRTNNMACQYYQEFGFRKQLGDFQQVVLFAPAQVSWLNGNSLNAQGQANQVKVALAGAYDIKLCRQRLDVAVNARHELINSLSILTSGADAVYSFAHWFSLRANIQRTYRVPTLTELYYFPGGNITLKPEQGWSEDAGYSVKMQYGNFHFSHDASLFNRNIRDWILWLGGAVWTPLNIAEVHSRGIETENDLEYTIDKWKIHLGAGTSYVLATTDASYIPNDGSVGKQIPYSPRYNGQLNIGFSYRQFSINYNHTYTGYRFITTDESGYLTPYQTGNLQLMYNTLVSHHSIQFTAQCNNIRNQQYQVVAYRPMPGINWLFGCKLNVL